MDRWCCLFLWYASVCYFHIIVCLSDALERSLCLMWYTRCWTMLVMTSPPWAGRWWWGASPLYILRSPYKGGTTYKRGRADTTCGAAENPLLTAVFRRLSSRHHWVAVGSMNCSHSMQHPVVKSLCFCWEEFILQAWRVGSPALRNKHLRRGHPRCHTGSSRSSRVIYCTLLHFIARYCSRLHQQPW